MASQNGVGRTQVRVMAEKPSDNTGKKRISKPLLLAIALIVGGVIYVVARSGGDEELALPPAGQTQYSQAALVEEVDKRIYNKDYDGAIRVVQGQNEADTPRIKTMLVSIYAAKGDLPAALRVYDELDEQGGLNSENYNAAAQLAEQAKDYGRARVYYTKAIERAMAENLPTMNDDIMGYRQRITELKDK